jgi:hypothetical protein
VIGVSIDEDWSSVKPFLKEEKVNYPVVPGNWDLAKSFGVGRGLPVTLLIDRDGKVADLNLGMVNRDAFENEIKTLLRKTPAT